MDTLHRNACNFALVNVSKYRDAEISHRQAVVELNYRVSRRLKINMLRKRKECSGVEA